MRLLLVSDAWYPQINGVVRTLNRVREELSALGHEVFVIHPGQFRSLPCPSYPEIRLALATPGTLGRRIEASGAQAIHIATEGPLGWAARAHCLRRGLPFTTSFHTLFAEYLKARTGAPLSLGYGILRRFHARSAGVMVATASIRKELTARGFTNLRPWSRGVDTALFHPREKTLFRDLPRPIFLYVGRVAIEKNIEAFLTLDLPGSKVVVGGGPQLDSLTRRFPDTHFTGPKEGEDLARHFASGDVFVFPSRTDTFGLVMLEALASGLPVAAFPVPGPLDVLAPQVGAMDEDLGLAARRALTLSPEACREHALTFSWQRCAEQFLEYLRPFA